MLVESSRSVRARKGVFEGYDNVYVAPAVGRVAGDSATARCVKESRDCERSGNALLDLSLCAPLQMHLG
jgi:hypothetical protein